MVTGPHCFALAFNPKLDTLQIYSGPGHSALDPEIFMKEPFSSSGACARLKKIAIDDSRLSGLYDADREDQSVEGDLDLGDLWWSLDEISVLLSPARSFQALTQERFRVLDTEKALEKEEGWGDHKVLSWLLGSLKNARTKVVSDPSLMERYNIGVGVKEKLGLDHLPVVKVVQWGIGGSSKEDPWCMPLTSVCLMKEGRSKNSRTSKVRLRRKERDRFQKKQGRLI
jgi:hypothetical protein